MDFNQKRSRTGGKKCQESKERQPNRQGIRQKRIERAAVMMQRSTSLRNAIINKWLLDINMGA